MWSSGSVEFALLRARVARRCYTTESELAHTEPQARTLNFEDDYTITGKGCVGAEESVVAHATTNTLLGGYVLIFSRWQLW